LETHTQIKYDVMWCSFGNTNSNYRWCNVVLISETNK